MSLNSSAIPAPSGFSVPMAPGSGLTAVYQDKTVPNMLILLFSATIYLFFYLFIFTFMCYRIIVL